MHDFPDVENGIKFNDQCEAKDEQLHPLPTTRDCICDDWIIMRCELAQGKQVLRN